MKTFMYLTGRTFQLIGLLILPSAIWVAEFHKSEAGAIGIFLAGIFLFFLGWIFSKVR
jgi:hypothetical protein